MKPIDCWNWEYQNITDLIHQISKENPKPKLSDIMPVLERIRHEVFPKIQELIESWKIDLDDEFVFVRIVDVLLREWDQAPWVGFNKYEKAVIAVFLAELWASVIELWFPASRADFENVEYVKNTLKPYEDKITISVLWRTLRQDTEHSLKALSWFKNQRIHMFLAMSDDHLIEKFWKKFDTTDIEILREKTLEMALEEIKFADNYRKKNDINLEIEFSPEDATWNSFIIDEKWRKVFNLENNKQFDFLIRVIRESIINGANIINLPDTLWNLLPKQTEKFFRKIVETTKDLRKDYIFTFSCHIHDDNALALANVISSIEWAKDMIVFNSESTFNWHWERAWNSKTDHILATIDQRRRDLIDDKITLTERPIINNLLIPIKKLVFGILWERYEEWKPFFAENKNGSWVHQVNEDLYMIHNYYVRYWWIEKEPSASARTWKWEVQRLLLRNWIDLSWEESKYLLNGITAEVCKRAETLKTMYSSNIFSIYLEKTKWFKIKSILVNDNSINVSILLWWEELTFSWIWNDQKWMISWLIESINKYLWEDIEIKDFKVTNKDPLSTITNNIINKLSCPMDVVGRIKERVSIILDDSLIDPLVAFMEKYLNDWESNNDFKALYNGDKNLLFEEVNKLLSLESITGEDKKEVEFLLNNLQDENNVSWKNSLAITDVSFKIWDKEWNSCECSYDTNESIVKSIIIWVLPLIFKKASINN